MKAFQYFYLLLTSLILVSCGGSDKTVSIQVTGLAITSAGYTGGLIAYGEGPNNSRFSVSKADGDTLNVTIIDGSWKILVMGWDDPSKKFHGERYCGMANLNLTAIDSEIKIVINQENCVDPAFQSEAAVQNLLVSSCGAFYKYNSPNDNYAPLSQSHDNNFCSTLPNDFERPHAYYKLLAMDVSNAQISPGMESGCISTDVANNSKIYLPTRKFPFTFLTFKSLQDCEANLVLPRASRFPFFKGLEVGNRISFDHHLGVDSTSNPRLILPSTMTKRGHSPFMNVIPRILCDDGSGNKIECFEKPSLPTQSDNTTEVQFDVNWEQHGWYNDRATILEKYNASHITRSCGSPELNFLNQSPDFSVRDCRIENGNLKGNFERNVFSCHSLTEMGPYIDIYEKAGKIYLVRKYVFNSTNDIYEIEIFGIKGNRLDRLQITEGLNSAYQSLAVDPVGNIQVIIQPDNSLSNRTLYQFLYDHNEKSYVNPSIVDSTYHTDINKIEIAKYDLGFLAGADNTIVAIDPRQNTIISAPTTPIGDIKKILYKGENLYILSYHSIDGKTDIFKASYTTAGLSVASTPMYRIPRQADSFHITTIDSILYAIVPSTNASDSAVVNLTSNAPLSYIATSTSLFDFRVIAIGNKVFTLEGSTFATAKLTTKTLTLGSTPAITLNTVNSTGECEANLTSTIDGTNYKLALNAKALSSVKPLFEDAFRYLGLRTVTSPNSHTYFESLQENHDGNFGSTSGRISRPIEMMSPQALGGVIAGFLPGKSCTEIRDMVVSGANIDRVFTLEDSIKLQKRTYALSISKPTSLNYDLTITLSSATPSPEKLRLQLSCTSKTGRLESMDHVAGVETRHELLIWNLQDVTTQWYENYEIEDRVENASVNTRISMEKMKFTANNVFSARSLELNRSPGKLFGRVNEFQSNGSNIMNSHENTTSPLASFALDPLYENTELFSIYTTANACMAVNELNPRSLNNLTCSYFSTTVIKTSLTAWDYSIKDLEINSRRTSTSASNFDKIFTLHP